MRRRKFLITLSFAVSAILIGVVFVAGKTASLAKEEKKAFDFNNVEAPHLMRVEGVPSATTTEGEIVNTSGLLTQYFGQALFKAVSENKIKTREGKNTLDLFTDPTLIEIATEEIARYLTYKELGAGDIKLIASNSADIKQTYIEKLEKIKSENKAPYSLDFVLNEAIEKKSFAPAEEISKYFYAVLQKYLDLETPAGLADFHIWLVNHFKKLGWIFGMLGNSENDPIQGAIALNLFEMIPDEEIHNLKKLRIR